MIHSNSQNLLHEHTAHQTLALNPLVGVTTDELLNAARTTALQAIRQPLLLLKSGTDFSRKLIDVAIGKRSYKADPKDRRFGDPTWAKSWLHRGLLQSYLALLETLDDWVDEVGFNALDKRRAQFVIKIIGDSISPTNILASNPSAIKQIVETGGGSIANGLRQFLQDQWNNNGMPSQVDKNAFELGVNLATTKGSVVFRNELLELIQYAPTTPKVHRRPLLFIPPQINKFYFYDLSPEKSFFRFCLDEGLQVFAVSWRNPSPENADWGMDQYISALKDAILIIQRITGSKTINVTAPCSGGMTASILAGHYMALDKDVINAMTLPVCVLQQEASDSDLTLFVNEQSIEAARRYSRKNGVLRGKELARIFAWMRPNDLIWNYVVNNYLLGNNPPAFDILYWNSDPTNLPAQLHSDFLDIVSSSALSRPGDLRVCDTPIDLKSVDCDLFIVGGLTDHLTPWQACYRTTKLMSGRKEFLLVGSGHIQSLVADPNNPKSYFFQSAEVPASAEEWLEGATKTQGTWWPHWSKWIRARSGAPKNAPTRIGSKIHPPLCDAPGSYVLEAAN